MDWKGIMAIAMACSLMGMGVWTNHCSEALSMICSAIVGGVFGLAHGVINPKRNTTSTTSSRDIPSEHQAND